MFSEFVTNGRAGSPVVARTRVCYVSCSRPGRATRLDSSMSIMMIHVLACYGAGMLGAITTLVTKRQGIFTAAVVAMVSGFAMHTVLLVSGVVREGHLPLYGAQEVCSFLGWALVLYFLVVQARFPTRALAGLLFPTATALTLIAVVAAPAPETPEALADNPYLFSIHAGFVLLAYAAFFTTFMAAVLYIVQEREIKGKHFGAIFHRLPSLDTCDSIGFRALAAGWVMLTAGIVFGMVWSFRRSGIVWNGQPIEIVAVCTWVVYFFLVHYRLTSGWRGRRAAIGAIVGFCLVVVSLAVLRYGSGFHTPPLR
jgi:ABC-type transport system involved in cytochrome c biogenesis permease subunit